MTVVGKLRFIPVVNDNDWMYINYEAALRLMVQAIRKEETNSEDASHYENKAIQLLQDQLLHYLGDGAVPIPRIQGVATYGGGGVANLQ